MPIVRYKISLTDEELQWAYSVGKLRQREAEKRGLPDKHGLYKGDGLEVHKIGAAGELAFAKLAGATWSADVNTFKKKADVCGFEVRTRTKDWYELIIRDDDKDDRPYVLVFADPPNFIVKGYMTGGEAKSHPEWKKDHGRREAAFFVPQHLMNDLPWDNEESRSEALNASSSF